MSEQEKRTGTVPAVTTATERREVAVARPAAGGRQVRSTFRFDSVLGSLSTQDGVFQDSVQPLVAQVLAGYEATAFAYGQTGTGKTYTMEGDADSEEGRGLMPRAAAAVLDALADEKYVEHSVTVSYLEIYNEELMDLLAPAHLQQKLDLMETPKGVQCIGLSEVNVSTLSDIQELVKAAQERRRVAETRMNARSSRSHCLFTMKVSSRQRVKGGELDCNGKLHLVDLAGSECAKKAGPCEDVARPGTSQGGAEQERERRNINQSLLTLGRVIAALREGSSRVPYRDSKLTRLLKDALGGSCKTVIIATVSPALLAVEETISTLTYAEQASGIQNRPVASSLFRLGSGEIRQAPSGTSAGVGSVDWAEMEMKNAYLAQELEEAQAALARKFQDERVLIEKKEQAEEALARAVADLENERKLLEESRVGHGDVATSARCIREELTAGVLASETAKKQAQKELEELSKQRQAEEEMVMELRKQQEHLAADLSNLHAKVDFAKAELDQTLEAVAKLKAEQERSFEEALKNVLAYATAEFGRHGAACSRTAEAVEGLRSSSTLLGNAGDLVDGAKERSAAASGQAVSSLQAWAENVSARCGALCERYGEAAHVAESAATVAAERMRGLETKSTALASGTSGEGVLDANTKENQENIIVNGSSAVAAKLREAAPGPTARRAQLRDLNH